MREAAADHRSIFVKAGLAYCLLLVYASTVIGPVGIHFVPIELHTAWRRLLASGYDNGLVLADWNSNLLMLVPLGFISAGAAQPRRAGLRRGLAALAALGFCLLFVVAVKFAQLYFPPRTVSLDYILAQSLGSLIGVGLFVGARRPLAQARARLAGHGRAALSVALAAYAIALLGFLLFPFDVALSGAALHQKLLQLPHLLRSVPGAGAAMPWPLFAPVVESIETVPVGLLIGLHWRRRVPAAAAAGFAAMAAVCLMQIPILSAVPSVPALLCHTLGIVLGAAAVGSIQQLTLIRWRLTLARAVPGLALAYVLLALAAKGLFTLDWRTPAQAWAALDPRGLMPFWNDYIVSKSHAAVATAAHVVLFAPIGVMVWLRRGVRPGAGWLAAILAVILSFVTEAGRWLQPGLQPDFSNLIIAAIAASLAIPLSEWLWGVLVESFPTPGMPSLRRRPGVTRAATAPTPARATPASPVVLWPLPPAIASAALAVAILAHYPLPIWPLALALLVYAGVLTRWPVAWLLVIPAVLPAVDLAPWTGWLEVGEADLFVLVTLAVLLLRAPPGREDLALDRFSAAALLLACIAGVVSLAIGLFRVPAPPTANPYLAADNGLRLARGFVGALVLLPFLGRELRGRPNALAWLGAGVVAGLALVCAAAVAERAVFVGLFDFRTAYRIVATFSTMHVGGGHLATYLAMAIPFLSLCLLRPRWGIPAGLVGVAVALYALVVTYSRTGYTTAVVGSVVVCFGWAVAARRGGGRSTAAAAPLFGGIALAAGLGAVALGSGFMHGRLEHSGTDLTTREDNWSGGLAARDPGAVTWLFGMGLGTYPRVYRARAEGRPAPSNYRIGHLAGLHWLELEPGDSTFYFGQKVPIEEPGAYRLSLDLRLPDKKSTLAAILCEKLLLYSDHCTTATFGTVDPGKWTHRTAVLQVRRLARPVLFGMLRRPVDLALHIGAGAEAEFTAVRLVGPHNRELLHNGDFAAGTDRWYFTDDFHSAWRIFNQFAMLLFEEGVIGVVAYLVLTAAALFGLWRAMLGGNRAAAPVAGGICAFFCAGALEAPLEAPRLAALFYLLCFAGLLSSRAARPGPPA
jgi:hypothetical protein